MAIRLITKKTGRLSPKTHCMMFYMGKGNNIYGKPYGIIPTSEEDPLGLTFDETNLTIYINPGQAYCYGRQCVVSEKTQVFDMHGIVDGKCYVTLYLRIDLSDIVDQFCKFSIVYGTEAFVDFDLEMKHSNLYKRGDGIYDVPIARFVYTAEAVDGKHFSNYEKIIPILDEQARAVVTSPLAIGKTPTNEMFSGERTEVRALQADMAKTTNMIGSTRIYPTIDNVWTAKRVKILDQSDYNFNSTKAITKSIKLDSSRLQYVFLESDCLYTKTSNGVSKNYNLYMKFETNLTTSILVKLNFGIRMQLGKKYFLGLDGNNNNRIVNGYPIWKITIKEDRHTSVNLAWVMLTETGVQWQGLYNIDRREFVSGYYLIGQPLLISGFDEDNMVFYEGPRGLNIYLDFLYKGDVNVS